MVRCAYCGEPVDPASPVTWRRVIGWERKALAHSRRSGSDIVLREPRDEWACVLCIRRLKEGLAPGQGSLAV